MLLVGTVATIISQNVSKADEVPAFFLKIAKNIPRVGRSDGYEDYLLKSRKNILKHAGHIGETQVPVINVMKQFLRHCSAYLNHSH